MVNGRLGNTAVTVTNGAVLGGTGTVWGTVNVYTNSHLAPGSGSVAGTLTLTNGLVLRNGAVLDFDLGSPASDSLRITGGTYANAGSVTVNLFRTGGTSPYTLIDWSGATTSGVDLVDFVLSPASAQGCQLSIEGSTLKANYAPSGTLILLR